MDLEEKPVVYYSETNPIIVGEPAYICAHNHPRNPNKDEWHARTSTVLAYNLITGDIETRNTIYKLKVELKSTSKTDHEKILAGIIREPHMRVMPLTNDVMDAMSDSVKHMLTDNGHSFRYVTCDNCMSKALCDLAFDPYNTDGDCLFK